MKIVRIMLSLLFITALSGCASFQPQRHDLGVTAAKPPVLGITYADFKVNGRSDRGQENFFAKENAEYLAKNGGRVQFVDYEQYPQIKQAVANFARLNAEREVRADLPLGDMKADFKAAGIDGLVIVTGWAQSRTLRQTLTELGLISLAAKFSTAVLPSTPNANFTWLLADAEGVPISYDGCGYYRALRREIGDQSARFKMYDKNYHALLENVPSLK